MRIKSVYIINAGNDPYQAAISNDSSFPPLGIISLGTMIEKDFEVRLFDGQIMSKDFINKEIIQGRPSVVAVSVLSTSYNNALSHIKAAKDVCAVTIFGNDQAAIFGENMLKKRADLDYVCTADMGEFVFSSILRIFERSKTFRGSFTTQI